MSGISKGMIEITKKQMANYALQSLFRILGIKLGFFLLNHEATGAINMVKFVIEIHPSIMLKC